ncbi:MAG TPA: xanthine dehydrogenase family protein subunit M [Ktedonobacterales bacterium]|nr:xanthine dehydrogenase family protein subunit M [Ktedonobacterales bacterium]
MIPDDFTYFAPSSLPQVWDLLRQYQGDAKILAGGQSLIPLMKLRLASPAYLIDLRKVPGLTTLEERDGSLVIGAMVRETTIEHSPLIQQRYPGIYDASAVVADPLVRNFATVGGNVAHADPANDHPAMLLALQAQVTLQGPHGTRTMSLDDFLVDTMETALRDDEVLTDIRVPQPLPHTGSAYLKLERKVGDYAIAAVGAMVTLDGGVCTRAGIGLTNVGPKAIPATQAETYLTGKRPDEPTIREAARLAAEAAEPTTDLHGPAEYKRSMVRTLTARALRLAVQRAEGGGQ